MTTPDQMKNFLEAGAKLSGSNGLRAAVHLLTFTELPGRVDFADHVDIETVEGRNKQPVTGAWVRDWAALARHDGLLYLTGGDMRLLALAASLARGIPVDLRAEATGLGTAYAKRTLEAVAIGLGMTDFYAITEMPALAAMRAEADAFLAGS